MPKILINHNITIDEALEISDLVLKVKEKCFMLKNRGILIIEEKSACIKERNSEIRKGNFTTINGGDFIFGDLIIVGENYECASIYLSHCVASAMNVEEVVEFEKETEDIYDVQVWHSTDFDLNAVINGKENE